MARPAGVIIEGGDAKSKDLQTFARQLQGTVDDSLRIIGIETANDARKKASGQGSMAAKGAASIRGGVEFRGAFVDFGGNQAPFMAGAEFGGGLHGAANPTSRGGYTTQFRPWRGKGSDAGYFIWPTVRQRQRNDNKRIITEDIEDLARKNDLT